MDHNNHATIGMSNLLLYLLLFSLLINHTLCAAVCNSYDKSILLQIKEQLGNPPSLESWSLDSDCCNDYWGGINAVVEINCDNHGHVVGFSIDYASDLPGEILLPALGDLLFLETLKITSSFNHSTPISPSICSKYNNLRSLTITDSKLSGPIPDCLGQLRNLIEIDLSSNSLTGPIPSGLGQLSKLQTLFLYSNNLSGPIPDFPTSMSGLYWISVLGNNISGLIPESLALLSNLSSLSLGYNRFYGPIPASFGHIPNLSWLDLSSNNLTGLIPDSFGSLPNNVGLVLSNNKLYGHIPKSLSKIRPGWLDLSGNNFIGDASFFFRKDQWWLEKIDLSRNRFKFNFSTVGFSEAMGFINISHNKIYGSIPAQLGEMQYLWSTDVSYNRLCGPIPTGPVSARFSPENFSHNRGCLCGPPLAPCK